MLGTKCIKSTARLATEAMASPPLKGSRGIHIRNAWLVFCTEMKAVFITIAIIISTTDVIITITIIITILKQFHIHNRS